MIFSTRLSFFFFLFSQPKKKKKTNFYHFNFSPFLSNSHEKKLIFFFNHSTVSSFLYFISLLFHAISTKPTFSFFRFSIQSGPKLHFLFSTFPSNLSQTDIYNGGRCKGLWIDVYLTSQEPKRTESRLKRGIPKSHKHDKSRKFKKKKKKVLLNKGITSRVRFEVQI